MITEKGSPAKVFEVDEYGKKVKFTTLNADGQPSAWFSVFDGVGTIPKVGDYIQIKKFVFESIPNVNRHSIREYPVTLKVTQWEILSIT